MQARQSQQKTDENLNKRARDECKSGWWVGADEKNKWSVSGEVLQRGRRQRILRCKHTPCHDQSMHWMIYFPCPILSPWKKKIYIPLNYWGFYFERRMWLWMWLCRGKRLAIRCGNHATKKCHFFILFFSSSVAVLIFSPFYEKCNEYTYVIKKMIYYQIKNIKETPATRFSEPLFLM